MLMRTKILLSTLTFILAIILSGYLYLSVSAGRAISVSEFSSFSGTILWAAALHMNENGGSRALNLSKQALSSAPSNGMIEVVGKSYDFPLPKYSVPRDEGNGMQHYLTFASFAELQDYFNRELPEAGWAHVDQMGAGHFFEGHGAHMVITHHFYLTTGISEINFSIRNDG